MDRLFNIPVLVSVLLVLFCLNFLTFIDRQFSQDGDAVERYTLDYEQTAAPAQGTRYHSKTQCEEDALLSPSLPSVADPALSEELRLRAAQAPESDQALRQELELTGQEMIHIPIMR